MTRVTVSRGEARGSGEQGQKVYECLSTQEGFICRACGFGRLGFKPDVGAACPECGARVEEVIEDNRRRLRAI